MRVTLEQSSRALPVQIGTPGLHGDVYAQIMPFSMIVIKEA